MRTEIATAADRTVRHRRRITPLGILLRGGMALLALQPVIHPHNTGRIASSLLGFEVNCFQDGVGETEGYPYGAIIVLGGGFLKNVDGTVEPGKLHKLRVQAAAVSYIQGKAPIVILLDGKLEDGIDPDLDRNFLKSEVVRLSGGASSLPDYRIFVDDKSFNTATNLDEYNALTDQLGVGSALMITNRFHMQRAALLACNKSANVDNGVAEDILVGFDPLMQGEIDGIYASVDENDLQEKEIGGKLEMLFDPKQIIWTAIKDAVY